MALCFSVTQSSQHDPLQTRGPLPAVVETEPGLETQRLQAAIGARLFGDVVETKPTTIGRHVLLQALGAGGMGVVYAAYDPQLDRRVAIKLLRPGLVDSVSATKRLLREAKAMAKLNHPHVIAVHDAGVEGDRVYLAMEHIDGGTLKTWCEAHPDRTRARFCALLVLLRQAALGLSAAHAAELVHRDLKPENMLVDAQGRLRVADFGLAYDDRALLSTASDTTSGTSSGTGAARSHSATEGVVGTPIYMAPEQFLGSSDARTDQWAWCATAWEAAYGERAFEGRNVHELLERREAGPPKRPSGRPDVPAWFHRVLQRGLQRDPQARYPSMLALLGDIGRREGRTRRGLVAVGGMATIGAAVWGWTPAVVDQTSPCDTLSSEAYAVYGTPEATQIRSHVAGLGGPSAATRAEQVVSRLDAFVAAWISKAEGACRDLGARGMLAGDDAGLGHVGDRMGCFADALDQLQLTLDEQLQVTDARDALTLLDALPTLEHCATAPARAPEATPALREVATDVAQITTLVAMRRDDRARSMLDATEARLEALDAPQLTAALLLQRSQLDYVTDDEEAALAAARAALTPAERANDPTVVASAWKQMSRVAIALGRLDEAAFFHERAHAASARAGDPRWLSAAVLANEASLAFAQKDFERARTLGIDVERRYADLYGTHRVVYAVILEHRIPPLRALGRHAEAVALGERVVDIYAQAQGGDHPSTAGARLRLGSVLLSLGETERAIALLRSASEGFLSYPHATARQLVASSMGLAEALGDAGRQQEALPIARAARERIAATQGAEHPLTLMLRMVEGNLLLESNHPGPAIEIYESLGGRAIPPDGDAVDFNALSMCGNLALAYAQAERPADALSQQRGCDALATRVTFPDAVFGATADAYAGDVFRLSGRGDEARRRYLAALAAFDEVGASPMEASSALLGIAELDLAAGASQGVRERLDEVRRRLGLEPHGELQARLVAAEASLGDL